MNCLLFHNIPLWLATICFICLYMRDSNKFTSSFPLHTAALYSTLTTDYIWVVNCNCKCNYVSYCIFSMVLYVYRSISASGMVCVCVYKYHTIKRPKRTKPKMHFISNVVLFWLKPIWCVYLCVNIVRVSVSEWAKRNQIVIITNKQFWGAVFWLN